MTNRELHYNYIISYLLVAIIIILALAYYNVPDLVDKLSFALTLSSLLLAILAIFYTIISANKQDDQFTKLIETHSELKASAGEIKNVSKNINSILSDIPRNFESLGEKLDSLKENYNSPPPKLIQSEEDGNISPDIGLNIDRQILAKMVIHLQFSAMGVLYLFTQAEFKAKNIEFSYFKELDLISHEYGIGVLTGFEATGLIDFKIHEGSIIPIKCDNLLRNELLKILEGIIQVANENNGKTLNEMISNVNKLII